MIGNININLKIKLNGCDIYKVASILGNSEEISDEMVAYNKDAIDAILIELTKLKLVAEE